MPTVHLSDAARNAMADAFSALIDAGAAGGTIKIYDGTMPASVGTAVSTQTLLGTLTFSATAFGAAAAGVITAAAIAPDSTADATGTAAWARIADSDATDIADVDVGATASGATIELNTTSITAGGAISISSFTFTMPSGE